MVTTNPQFERLEVRLRGRVQGVGCRPFLHGLARRFQLAGVVRNDANGVTIEVEGGQIGAFLAALQAERPPLMRIDELLTRSLLPTGRSDFQIEASQVAGERAASIPPDVAVCPACLNELFDAADRRHLYPFINCTHCGPRYTITAGLPYDRPQTSMAGFELCIECLREYRDLGDRRYHAQPVACPSCGPTMTMEATAIVEELRAGRIVAIKGLGGFHLAVDARNAWAIKRLRRRKRRAGKPFAVMVANLASARLLARIGVREAECLCSAERPIVLTGSLGDLPEVVSGGLDTLGLMLPYTPLHYLLFHAAAGRPPGTAWLDEPQSLALIMTSANPSAEPLVIDDDEAHVRLAGIADRLAGHDRAIVTRCDDSVLRVVGGAPMFLRRARGYTPDALPIGEDGPTVLGTGALLKVAPCLLRGREALPGQHIGNVLNRATVTFFEQTVDHLIELLGAQPEAIACDTHPDYATTRWAEARAEQGLELVRVQHHHAHLAALAAEHRIRDDLTGLVLDGFGLGEDGSLWGGELLILRGGDFRRAGHLAPLPLPGGDRAAMECWRMAAGVLHSLGRQDEIVTRFDHRQAQAVARWLGRGDLPVTTACGRLFDAAAALLGVCLENRFEAEAAMRLESLCNQPQVLNDGWTCADGLLDFSPLLDALCDCDAKQGAELFHGTLAAGLCELAMTHLPNGQRRLGLAGGCAVNAMLTERLKSNLAAEGIDLLLPRRMPPGDGGLALGQALIARRKLAAKAC